MSLYRHHLAAIDEQLASCVRELDVMFWTDLINYFFPKKHSVDEAKHSVDKVKPSVDSPSDLVYFVKAAMNIERDSLNLGNAELISKLEQLKLTASKSFRDLKNPIQQFEIEAWENFLTRIDSQIKELRKR